MDWLRRNWPDLLIGVALVMVIAMIVVTLLSGGSLASLVRRDAPQPLTTGAGTAGTGSAPADTATAGTSSGDDATGADAANTTDAAGSTGTDSTGAEGASGDLDVFVPEVPGQDATTEGGTETEGDGEVTAPDSRGDVTASSATGTGDDLAGAATADGPLPAASQRGRFRVAAGATGSRDGARTSAETLRSDGYEVTVEQKNDLYLLWVGPYASNAGAERVAARLRTDGLVPDAIVYGYGGESADTEAASETDATSAEGSDATATATPNGGGAANPNALASNAGAGNTSAGSAGADVSSSGASGDAIRTPPVGATGAATEDNSVTDNSVAEDPVAEDPVAEDLAAGAEPGQGYLQVGAFASDENAAPRREQLEQLGLTVSSSETDNGLLRLFVGPYGETQMAQIQTRLTAQGIESFPVSQ